MNNMVYLKSLYYLKVMHLTIWFILYCNVSLYCLRRLFISKNAKRYTAKQNKCGIFHDSFAFYLKIFRICKANGHLLRLTTKISKKTKNAVLYFSRIENQFAINFRPRQRQNDIPYDMNRSFLGRKIIA